VAKAKRLSVFLRVGWGLWQLPSVKEKAAPGTELRDCTVTTTQWSIRKTRGRRFNLQMVSREKVIAEIGARLNLLIFRVKGGGDEKVVQRGLEEVRNAGSMNRNQQGESDNTQPYTGFRGKDKGRLNELCGKKAQWDIGIR